MADSVEKSPEETIKELRAKLEQTETERAVYMDGFVKLANKLTAFANNDIKEVVELAQARIEKVGGTFLRPKEGAQ